MENNLPRGTERITDTGKGENESWETPQGMYSVYEIEGGGFEHGRKIRKVENLGIEIWRIVTPKDLQEGERKRKVRGYEDM